MSSSKLIFGLICFLSSITLILAQHVSSETYLAQKVSSPAYISSVCSKSGNYKPNSLYEQNLNGLFGVLNLKTPPTGFSTSSMGNKPDRTHGLALCRGDVSSDDCKSCVLAASKQIVKDCPYDKEAIIWYTECMLKYSDNWFRGEIDYKYKGISWNPDSVSNPEYFDPLTKELLVCLTEKAQEARNLYAAKEIEFGKNEKLYGLVQCTRDLSNEDCKSCLDDIINNDLPKCCAGKKGAKILTGSCKLRYEVYPFFN